MAEWVKWREPDSSGEGIYNWELNGEIKLDLMLGGDPPHFEIARILESAKLAKLIIQDPIKIEYALDDIQRGDSFVNVCWSGYSPKTLEKYCKEHLLPLPIGYKEDFEHLNKRYL